MEQGMYLNHNDQQLDELLMRFKNNDFNQFDDQQLRLLININKPEDAIFTQIMEQFKNIAQTVLKIEDQLLLKKIKDAKINIITQETLIDYHEISTSAISNDFKYIVTGGTDKQIKIWNYHDNKFIKAIQFDNCISKIKFTDDSRILYVGKGSQLIQLDIDNNFKETLKIHYQQYIKNIYCITNTIILISGSKVIIKTDINNIKQLLIIKAHDQTIQGLDHNRYLNIIASATSKSIKLWNDNDGQLILEKEFANKDQSFFIEQILFMMNNQLIMMDQFIGIFILQINYQTKQLELLRKLKVADSIYNISLTLNQKYISLICQDVVKIYSINGDLIRKFNHEVNIQQCYNFIQPNSMKAYLIQGQKMLQICKVNLD